MLERHISLIKSGGGNGPMKPGNLRKRGAKSGGETKDEDSIVTHIGSVPMCVFYWYFLKGSYIDGKKTVYF